MSVYSRGNEEKPEAYIVRILAALVRQAGGEVRIKGEFVDEVNEGTILFKEWDKKNAELVLRVGMHSFPEMFRVVPERQQQTRVEQPPAPVDPMANFFHEPKDPRGFTEKTSTLENPNLPDLEKKRRVAQAAATLRNHLRERAKSPNPDLT